MAAATAGGVAGARWRQGGHRIAAAHARGRGGRLALRPAPRLGHGGRGTVCDLGLRAGCDAPSKLTPERGGVMRQGWAALAAFAIATSLAAQEFHPPPVRRADDRGTRLGLFGFELHYRSTFNWLLEYHGMDAFRRNRVYVGLTTRRGN